MIVGEEGGLSLSGARVVPQVASSPDRLLKDSLSKDTTKWIENIHMDSVEGLQFPRSRKARLIGSRVRRATVPLKAVHAYHGKHQFRDSCPDDNNTLADKSTGSE